MDTRSPSPIDSSASLYTSSRSHPSKACHCVPRRSEVPAHLPQCVLHTTNALLIERRERERERERDRERETYLGRWPQIGVVGRKAGPPLHVLYFVFSIQGYGLEPIHPIQSASKPTNRADRFLTYQYFKVSPLTG